MTVAEWSVLVVAGVGAGLTGSIAGLASLVSYPALLAVGLLPVTANVTNTVALVLSSVGSVSASRPELAGQGRRLGPMVAAGLVGGAAGAALLLLTPPEAFERLVPVLIGGAALQQDPVRVVAFVLDLSERRAAEREREVLLAREREAR
ncbi:MAG TPA: TSUP family transporter, partial [Geodermatophilus sp.]|nr:TSUP family transporter [Geodermatophilus sp.]